MEFHHNEIPLFFLPGQKIRRSDGFEVESGTAQVSPLGFRDYYDRVIRIIHVSVSPFGWLFVPVLQSPGCGLIGP